MGGITSRRFGLLATVCLALVEFVNSTPVKASVTVKPGQKIQAAIDAAKPGATILVKAGTYAEQLTIKIDGITLVGEKGTVIVPPNPPVPAAKQNLCYGTAGPGLIAGICVVGKDVVLLPYPGQEHSKVKSVGKYVKGVSVTGFEVRGFSGENIALYGAENALITRNKLVDGLVYGYLAAGSKNTEARHNTVLSTGLVPGIGFRYIAMCSDNIQGATVWGNDIDNYGIALCIQTNGANIQHNQVTNSCYGVFVDPGVDGAVVLHNKIGPTNPDCIKNFGVTSGIVVFGASNTQVKHNEVFGQSLGAAATLTNAGAGIAVFDAGPALLANNNRIVRNEARNNDIDLAIFSSGTGNVVEKNQCATPTELCSDP
ncbi:pectin lyase fold/virulence factor [Bisporella sp. PMI_857]|nr:pectin lyase fold/virulence factor [Bisporella sp. PMI_857]